MGLRSWSKSRVDYGRDFVRSGLEGARSGREAFLNGKSLTPFLSESVRDALKPAAIGICLGVLGSCSSKRPSSLARTLAYGVLGGAVGLGAGVAWQNRDFAASVAAGALKNISKVRDEHWLARHPIDYA